MSQFALLVLFILIRVVFEVCKQLPQAPTRRYRTRRRRDEFESTDRDTLETRSKNSTQTLRGIARRLKGVVDVDSDLPSINFFRHGSSFQAFITHQHGVNSIRLLAHWPDQEFRLRIFPDQRRTKHWKKDRHLEDIVVGNDHFDKAFVVHGNNAKSIKELLSDKICMRIYSHTKRAHGRISIKINGNEFEFGGKATRLLGDSQVVTIINNLVDIHRLMLKSYSGLELVGAELVFVEKRQSTCMVCGDQVGRAQTVTCKDCKTRHHRDCWHYIGKCSTYGCHSRRAL